MYLVFFGCASVYQAFAYLLIIFGFEFIEKKKETENGDEKSPLAETNDNFKEEHY